jgi:hypothetical protein
MAADVCRGKIFRRTGNFLQIDVNRYNGSASRQRLADEFFEQQSLAYSPQAPNNAMLRSAAQVLGLQMLQQPELIITVCKYFSEFSSLFAQIGLLTG